MVNQQTHDPAFAKLTPDKDGPVAGVEEDFHRWLVTEGNLGLYEAARRFDERKGCAFISYAVWWIRRNLNKALAEQVHLVRYPHSRQEILRDVCRAEERLEKHLEREPSLAEIASVVGRRTQEIQEALASVRAYSMVTDYEDTDRESPLSRIADEDFASAPDSNLEDREMHAHVREAVESLNQREELIINLYFGLTGEEPHTFLRVIDQHLAGLTDRFRHQHIKTR